jgi:hypothetical protein
MALDERTVREMTLAGDGTMGGGLPLPIVFTAVVQDLLDNGPADMARLREVITASLSIKEERVFEIWGTWERFTRAVLDQLTDDEVIVKNNKVSVYVNDTWSLPSDFKTAHRYPVMGKWNMGVTVYKHEDRRLRDHRAQAKMLVIEFAERLNRLGTVGHPYAVIAREWADELTDMSATPSWGSEEKKESSPEKKRVVTHRKWTVGPLDFFLQWWEKQDDGEWHTVADIVEDFNKENPDQPLTVEKAGSMRRQAKRMVQDGKLAIRQGRGHFKDYRRTW